MSTTAQIIRAQERRHTAEADAALGAHRPQTFPWDRLPCDIGESYDYFLYFREQGPGRTLTSIWKDFGKSERYIKKLSSERRWWERARAWDDHVRRQAELAVIEAARTMATRQATLGMEMQDLAMSRVKDFKEPEMKATLTVGDAIRLAETGVKIERLARGENTGDEGQLTFVVPGGLPKWAPQHTPVQDKLEPEPLTIQGEVVNGN